MSESNFWKQIYKGTKDFSFMKTQRHEDNISKGIPDVSFAINNNGQKINGWMELKHIKSFPKKRDSIIAIDHYTDDQRKWLLENYETGGATFLFIKIDREYYLFTGSAMVSVGYRTKDWWLTHCIGCWVGSVDWKQFVYILIRHK